MKCSNVDGLLLIQWNEILILKPSIERRPFDREQWTRGSGAVFGAVKRFHGNADVTQEMPRTLY